MIIPKTAKEAAEAVSQKAFKEGKSLSSYCTERGVFPQTIRNWQKSNKSYSGLTYERLMGKPCVRVDEKTQ